MTIRNVSAFAAVLLLASSWLAHAQQWSGEKALVVDVKAKELMSGPAAPAAVSIAVSINGVPQLAKGYGVADASTGQVANALTQFQIGSLTKQFTAAAILDMSGSSRRTPAPLPLRVLPVLNLDAALDTVLPAAMGWMPLGPASLRRLLNMQSGFTNFTSLDPAANGMPDTKSAISEPSMLAFIDTMMKVRPQHFAPGTQYEYSNTNYFLLAEAASKSGGDFHARLTSRIFKRADMSNTGFLDAAPNTGSRATAPYDTTKSNWNKPSWPKGAGDVVSTAPDILKWHAALMGGKLLNAARLQQMFKPVATVDVAKGIYYGMGWFIVTVGDVTWYYHNGSIAGFTSFDSILLNTKTGTWTSSVVLTNQDNVKLDKVSACLVQLAMDNAVKLTDVGPVPKAFCAGL